MKCALIVPSWAPQDIFPARTAAAQINYWQPLGTLYVAAAIRQAGHEVRFLDGAFMTHEEIMRDLSVYRPDFIGIYSTAFGWERAMRTASDARKGNRHSFITVGGPYPIAMQGACLQDSWDIDAVVTGEGEHTVVELLERLSGGADLRDVRGLAYRSGGAVVTNPPRPLISDLDSIPVPARDLLAKRGRYIPPPGTYRRKPVAVVMTSRGCSRKCIFCFQIDRDRKTGIRYRSIQNVADEIELCLSQGYREIKFIDDTLAGDYARAMELAQEIRRRKFDFSWFSSACVNQVDLPLLRAFKEAGCWAILLGAESGVQKDLNTLRKGITLDQIRRAVRDAKSAGLRVFTPFLFGIPGQSREDALKSIEFACEIDPDVANFHALTPFPGTELHDNLARYGTASEKLEEYTYQGAAFVPFTMSRDEISTLRQIAFRRFYSRPRAIMRRIMSIRTLRDIRVLATAFRSLIWLWISPRLFSRNNCGASRAVSPHSRFGMGRRELFKTEERG